MHASLILRHNHGYVGTPLESGSLAYRVGSSVWKRAARPPRQEYYRGRVPALRDLRPAATALFVSSAANWIVPAADPFRLSGPRRITLPFSSAARIAIAEWCLRCERNGQ